MVELNALLWGMAALFGYIGFTRGWNKEIIATAGIILGLFALFQFDDVLRGTLLVTVPSDQVFLVQTVIFGIIVFFAYQTRALDGDSGDRDELQVSVLGALMGFINGYLVWGTLWYFMEINNYPLAPFIVQPAANSPSAATAENLPLYLLAGGPGGGGELLSLAVIGLFLIVLIVI